MDDLLGHCPIETGYRLMRTPNFFLIGAPKAGTTSLSMWLRSHPDVFFSDPKEPFFWAEDLPGLRKWTGMQDIESYREIFRGANSQHRAVGEGSTIYLYSQVAVPHIVETHPEARFLVLLRHPVDLAHAFHQQLCFHAFEDERDFEKAWALQRIRRTGNRLPRHAICPELTQYRAVASLGEQVERLLEHVDRKQVLFLLFDDLRRSPGAVYRKVLEFLALEDDGRNTFEAENVSRVARSRRLNRWIHSRPARFVRSWAKGRLSTASRGHAGRLQAWLMGHAQLRRPLTRQFRALIEGEFREDILGLERCTSLDLSDWRT